MERECPTRWTSTRLCIHDNHASIIILLSLSLRFVFPTTRLGPESQFSDFLDGLGPAQIVGRQTLATPSMGKSRMNNNAIFSSSVHLVLTQQCLSHSKIT